MSVAGFTLPLPLPMPQTQPCRKLQASITVMPERSVTSAQHPPTGPPLTAAAMACFSEWLHAPFSLALVLVCAFPCPRFAVSVKMAASPQSMIDAPLVPWMPNECVSFQNECCLAGLTGKLAWQAVVEEARLCDSPRKCSTHAIWLSVKNLCCSPGGVQSNKKGSTSAAVAFGWTIPKEVDNVRSCFLQHTPCRVVPAHFMLSTMPFLIHLLIPPVGCSLEGMHSLCSHWFIKH